MAFLAFEFGLDVSLVRKMYKIRGIVNLDPGDRFLVFPILGDFLYLWLVTGNVVMAANTFIDAWYTS